MRLVAYSSSESPKVRAVAKDATLGVIPALHEFQSFAHRQHFTAPVSKARKVSPGDERSPLIGQSTPLSCAVRRP